MSLNQANRKILHYGGWRFLYLMILERVPALFHHNNKIILSHIFAFVKTFLCILHHFYLLHKIYLLSFNKLPIAKPIFACYTKDVKSKEDSPMNK